MTSKNPDIYCTHILSTVQFVLKPNHQKIFFRIKMNIFSTLKDYIEAKIDLVFKPNVEYVFEHAISEDAKAALVEISEHLISQLELDATVIEKMVFYYEDDENDTDHGKYIQHTKTIIINCAYNKETYVVIDTIAHELFHAGQFTKTWGFNARYNEVDAEKFAQKETDKLMPEYSERLEKDFPSNF